VGGKKSRLGSRIVASRGERLSDARGYLVLEQRLAFLERPLKEENFFTITAPIGTSDDDLMKLYLFDRVFVAMDGKEFEYGAAVHDYGLISLSDLPLLDPAQENNQTAKMISKAWKDFHLKSERFRFKLTLRACGHHAFETIE